MVSWATACLGVHRLFSFAFHSSVLFHSLFFTSYWISLMFLLYDRRICTHSVDHSLTHCLGEFPGLGCCGPFIRGGAAVSGSRTFDPNFFPVRDLNLGP